MSDLRTRLELTRDGQIPPSDGYERVLRRAEARSRSRRFAFGATVVLLLTLGLVVVHGLGGSQGRGRVLAGSSPVAAYDSAQGVETLSALGLSPSSAALPGHDAAMPDGLIGVGLGALCLVLLGSFGLILATRDGNQGVLTSG